MKRTVFGMLVMSSIVGLGSAGVYFAQKYLAPTMAVAEQSATDNPPRDLTPVPIPIASAADAAAMAPGSGNPFAHSAADRYQTVSEPEPLAPAPPGREAAPLVETVASEAMPSGVPEGAGEEPIDAYAQPLPEALVADEIPNADQVAGYDEPVSAAAEPPSRYAERTVAGEIQDAAGGDYPDDVPANEPRRLADDGSRDPAAAGVNPLRGAAVPAAVAAGGYAEAELGAEPTPARSAPPGGAAFEDAFGGEDNAVRPRSEGQGRPGDPALSGAQAPSLTIEKTAPPEIQVGKPAKFLIKVVNAGNATAHDVEIHDAVPQGTQLLDTAPPAQPSSDGTLVWRLGALKPREEKTVELQLMPTAEGEIGSVATVHFRAEASVRTLATKPMLDIEVFGPSQVHKDQQLVLRIKLSNPGSGAATGIVLSEVVPKGLAHEEGKELQLDLGALKPGESRELDLVLLATEAGIVTNVITAEAEGKLRAEARTEIEIVAPELQVALAGPKRRYLERNATHNITISNPGTAPAVDVDLVAVLPRTLQFVAANNGGQFDPTTHAVYWNLEELPPQETGTVKLTTLPLEAGEAKLLIKSSSKDGLKDEREEVVEIEGLAAINFQFSDLKDPLEVGAETAYEIRVTNQGSAAASNVRLAAILPQGLQALSAEAPVRFKIEGQHVVFEPIRQLAPKAEATLTVKVKAVAPGDHRVEVQVATDEIREPISKQESTRVYGDE